MPACLIQAEANLIGVEIYETVVRVVAWHVVSTYIGQFLLHRVAPTHHTPYRWVRSNLTTQRGGGGKKKEIQLGQVK